MSSWYDHTHRRFAGILAMGVSCSLASLTLDTLECKVARAQTTVAPSGCPAGSALLVDQVGYDIGRRNMAFVQRPHSGAAIRYTLVDARGLPIISGVGGHDRIPADWGTGAISALDLSGVKTPGSYRLEARFDSCRLDVSLEINADVFERQLISNLIYYFKGQRVSGADSVADAHLPRVDGGHGTIDLHGGWYDATGDYGVHLSHQNPSNFFQPQQTPLVVWALALSYERLAARQDRNFTQYLRRLQDEAQYGADFLVRLKRPGGSFYESIDSPGPQKRAADRHIADPDWATHVKKAAGESEWSVVSRGQTSDLTYQAGFRSGGGMSIAALALAASLGPGGAFSPGAYLQAAEEAYLFLEKNNRRLDFDGQENIIDQYCRLLAATELYRATHEDVWKTRAVYAARALEKQIVPADSTQPAWWRVNGSERPFFHPSDAGMPVVALSRFAETFPGGEATLARKAIRKAMEGEMARTAGNDNPFGYARQLTWTSAQGLKNRFFFPHDTEAAPWWQGENARLASLAAAARMSATVLADDPDFVARLNGYADDQIHWILGRNPFDSAMMMGVGHNNYPYFFFGTWQYTNAPGAILNGATSAPDTDLGITFRATDPAGGLDQTWRWTEQWLPHAAWMLLAVSGSRN